MTKTTYKLKDREVFVKRKKLFTDGEIDTTIKEIVFENKKIHNDNIYDLVSTIEEGIDSGIEIKKNNRSYKRIH